jgi:serine/threonine protein kinase
MNQNFQIKQKTGIDTDNVVVNDITTTAPSKNRKNSSSNDVQEVNTLTKNDSVANLSGEESSVDHENLSVKPVSKKNLSESQELQNKVNGNEVTVQEDMFDNVKDGKVDFNSAESIDLSDGKRDGVDDTKLDQKIKKLSSLPSRKKLDELEQYKVKHKDEFSGQQLEKIEAKIDQVISDKLGSVDTVDINTFVNNFKKVTETPGISFRKSKILKVHAALDKLVAEPDPAKKLEILKEVKAAIEQYKIDRGDKSSKMEWVKQLEGNLGKIQKSCINDGAVIASQKLLDKVDEVISNDKKTFPKTELYMNIRNLRNDLNVLKAQGNDTPPINNMIKELNKALVKIMDNVTDKQPTSATGLMTKDIEYNEKNDKKVRLSEFTQTLIPDLNSDSVGGPVLENKVSNLVSQMKTDNEDFWKIAFAGDGSSTETLKLITNTIKSSEKSLGMSEDQINSLAESIHNGIVDGFNERVGNDLNKVEILQPSGNDGFGSPFKQIKIGNDTFTESGFLAEGGAGRIYTFKNDRTNEQIVLKEFMNESGDHEIQGNVLTAKGGDHENLTKLHGVHMGKDGRSYMLMEFAPGGDAEGIQKGMKKVISKLPEEDKLLMMQSISKQTMSGLSKVHESGVIHRDVKSLNYLYDNNSGKLKLCDLGEMALDKPGNKEAKGSIIYQAPEMIKGSGINEYDTNVDTWSLGVSLYEMYKGALPFGLDNCNTELDKKNRIVQVGANNTPPFADPQNEFEVMINKMLSKPEDRPALKELLENDDFFKQDYGSDEKAKSLMNAASDLGKEVITTEKDMDFLKGINTKAQQYLVDNNVPDQDKQRVYNEQIALLKEQHISGFENEFDQKLLLIHQD